MLESTFLLSLLPTRRSSSFRERRLAKWILPNRVQPSLRAISVTEGNEGGRTGFLNHHDGGNCTQKIADYFRNESATGQGGFDELTTISTACSSAANAIMLGAKLLESGEADIIVAGGSEALSRFHLNGFNSLMILDKKRCRPFDATRAG